MATRILFVHYTPPGVVGGAETVMHRHLELLSARGFRVQVVAGRAGPATLRAHVIPQLDVADPKNMQIEEQLAAGVVSPEFHHARAAILEKLATLVADAEFVIVHNAFTLHFCTPLTAALWTLAVQRKPNSMIAWCHDLAWINPLYVADMHDGYPWDLLRLPAPNTRYVTVSTERRRELQALWAPISGEVQAVPNGIDAASFLRLSPLAVELADRHRLFDRDLVLLLPVRITRRKNIEAGIACVHALLSRGIDACFLISGPVAAHHPARSAAYLQELKDLCEQLGVSDRVVFLSNDMGADLDDRTVADLFSLADVLLLPSSQEGFGLPILEAALARVPAVVTDIPIFNEVGGLDVRTFPLDSSPDRIADEILAATGAASPRLYRRVLREYRWDVVVERDLVPLVTE